MHYQLYWPNWWKLVPTHTKEQLPEYSMPYMKAVYINTFCFGPLQMRWYS